MQLKGSLTVATLPELMRQIYVERRTGELILRQERIRKQIYFELGQVVFAASNQREDKLGETLVRHGRLARQQLEELLPTLGSTRRLGRTLVEKGILTERELVTYVTFQIIDIIYSLFSWTVGEYEFAEGDYNRAPEELKLKFSTATIILEGVRKIEDLDLIRRGLGDLNRLIAPTQSPLLRMQSLVLKPVERQVLDLVTEPMDILRLLILAAPEPPKRIIQSLYGLICVGLLQQTAAPELSSETGKFVIPQEIRQQVEMVPPLDYRAPQSRSVQNWPGSEALLAEISEMKRRLSTNDPYIILGVHLQSTALEIRDAYYALAARFHPDKFIQMPKAVRADVDMIFSKLTESYNRLRTQLALSQSTGAELSAAGAFSIQQSKQGLYRADSASIPKDPLLVQEPYMELPKKQVASQQSAAQSAKEEIIYPGYEMHKLPPRSAATPSLETAFTDLIDYLEDRRAPLFVTDSLTMLFRTRPPIYVDRRKVVETIVTWARQKASWTGKPVHELLISALSSIKHAEQARVIRDFDAQSFYPSFIQEMAAYCPPGETQEFLLKARSI
ncbi:MAG: DUF4388 domain-containing protein [Acidobacteriota bacterium]|nr:DUF4388 domain-containing protein [Blastocatellia bacterium]MDW8413248.1 DUF4388 domain-containing protein [Acidobacteriota bacterium]